MGRLRPALPWLTLAGFGAVVLVLSVTSMVRSCQSGHPAVASLSDRINAYWSAR